jgi:hypothetical protein
MIDEFGFDSSFNAVWMASVSSTINTNGIDVLTNGQYEFAPTNTYPATFFATKTGFVKSNTLTLTATTTASSGSTGDGAGSGGSGQSTSKLKKAYDKLVRSGVEKKVCDCDLEKFKNEGYQIETL